MFFYVAIDYCPENKRDKDNDDRGDQTKKKMEIEFYLIVLYSTKWLSLFSLLFVYNELDKMKFEKFILFLTCIVVKLYILKDN